jgi:plastocyanin
MTRRIPVAAVAAVAAFGVAAAPAAAAKKNEIRVVGGVKMKAGKWVKDDQRFKAMATTVKSGATVNVVNKTKMDPHTISFIEKKYLPKSLFEENPVFGPLMAAHQAPEGEGEPGVLVVDDGAADTNDVLEVDTLGNETTAGDSIFFAPGQNVSFKVTAAKGSTLPYFCAIHPWMQGKIKVN